MIATRGQGSGVRHRAPRVGRAPLDRQSREFALLLLGHLIVFGLSITHDEIVAELVEDGYLLARLAERFELLLAFGLFVCWGLLSVRMAKLMADARTDRSQQDE